MIKADNVVDQAAQAASSAVGAARSAASSTLDSLSYRVESVRSTLSPMLDDALDATTRYTRKKPLQALAWAVVAGVVLSAVLRPARRY